MKNEYLLNPKNMMQFINDIYKKNYVKNNQQKILNKINNEKN